MGCRRGILGRWFGALGLVVAVGSTSAHAEPPALVAVEAPAAEPRWISIQVARVSVAGQTPSGGTWDGVKQEVGLLSAFTELAPIVLKVGERVAAGCRYLKAVRDGGQDQADPRDPDLVVYLRGDKQARYRTYVATDRTAHVFDA